MSEFIEILQKEQIEVWNFDKVISLVPVIQSSSVDDAIKSILENPNLIEEGLELEQFKDETLLMGRDVKDEIVIVKVVLDNYNSNSKVYKKLVMDDVDNLRKMSRLFMVDDKFPIRIFLVKVVKGVLKKELISDENNK